MEALTANTKQSQANPVDEGWGMDYRSDKSRWHHHHENTAHRVNITGLIGDQRKWKYNQVQPETAISVSSIQAGLKELVAFMFSWVAKPSIAAGNPSANSL